MINIASLKRATFRGAFRVLKTTDPLGHTAHINVPNSITNADTELSLRRLDGFLTMHAGAFTEVAYQAYLSFHDWFRFHRPKECDANLIDFDTRLHRAFKFYTRYQQKFTEHEFVEAYYALVCGDQQANIEKLRSAAYDLFKQDREHTQALDAAFVAQVYLCACYQCSIAEAVIHAEFTDTGINWTNAFKDFFLTDVAQFADRLLQRKYHIDIVAVRQPLSKIAAYVFHDMTRKAFDHDRIEHNIRTAYLDMPQHLQQHYGSIDSLLSRYPVPDYKSGGF